MILSPGDEVIFNSAHDIIWQCYYLGHSGQTIQLINGKIMDKFR